MPKKKYYMIFGGLVLVLTTASILTVGIKKNIAKFVFTQIKKQDLKEPTQLKEQTRLIIQHLKRGENDLAIELSEKYLKSDPNDIATINVLTEAYINKSDLSAAETAVKRAIAIQPNDPWSCRLLARIYRIKSKKDTVAKINNLKLALEQAETGLASNPNDIWLLDEAAQIYAEQGDNVKANQTIDRALSISPDNTFLKTIKEKINSPITAKEEIKK